MTSGTSNPALLLCCYLIQQRFYSIAHRGCNRDLKHTPRRHKAVEHSTGLALKEGLGHVINSGTGVLCERVRQLVGTRVDPELDSFIVVVALGMALLVALCAPCQ